MESASTQEDHSHRKWWLVVFLAAFAIYSFTAADGPQWQDSGWQQLRILRKQISHPLGLALVHPLHHFLGRAAVFCLRWIEPAYAITLVSALAGAIAVANVAGTVLVLTRRPIAAVIAAGSLLVAHTFWQHATHTESYTLSAALLSTEWLFLSLYARNNRFIYLYAVLLLNGLGVSNHVLALIATPVDAIVLVLSLRRARISGRQFFFACLAWLAGTAPYLALVLVTLLNTGDVVGAIRSALFGTFAPAVLNVSLRSGMLFKAAGYILYNVPNLTLPLAIYGILRRPRGHGVRAGQSWPSLLPNVLLAELAMYGAFVIRYAITDQYTFFFPIYMIAAVFCGFGAAALAARNRHGWIIAALMLIIASPLFYLASARALAQCHAFPAVEGKPYRDDYRSLFVPWGCGDDHARRLNEAALALAGADGLILVADPMTGFSLDYLQTLHRIPADVRIQVIATLSPERAAPIRAAIQTALNAGRTVVLVPAHRDRPDTYFNDAVWERRGDLYILQKLDRN